MGALFFFFGGGEFSRGSCLGCLNAIYGPDVFSLCVLQMGLSNFTLVHGVGPIFGKQFRSLTWASLMVPVGLP